MAAPAEIKTYPSYLFHMDFVQYRPLFLATLDRVLLMPKGSRICKKGITREWMYYLYQGTLKVYTCNSTAASACSPFWEKTVFRPGLPGSG